MRRGAGDGGKSGYGDKSNTRSAYENFLPAPLRPDAVSDKAAPLRKSTPHTRALPYPEVSENETSDEPAEEGDEWWMQAPKGRNGTQIQSSGILSPTPGDSFRNRSVFREGSRPRDRLLRVGSLDTQLGASKKGQDDLRALFNGALAEVNAEMEEKSAQERVRNSVALGERSSVSIGEPVMASRNPAPAWAPPNLGDQATSAMQQQQRRLKGVSPLRPAGSAQGLDHGGLPPAPLSINDSSMYSLGANARPPLSNADHSPSHSPSHSLSLHSASSLPSPPQLLLVAPPLPLPLPMKGSAGLRTLAPLGLISPPRT
eukprot:TRINITY_DN990_c0_g2_i5.p1 TRINITY_DN990_c0_g2~~TRINITY_DN990_c0_g2_i5.p1  ORF type:complete len:315 (-),score=59.28 TRINITY_DN990_c0_g2_i5:304-1248(-)